MTSRNDKSVINDDSRQMIEKHGDIPDRATIRIRRVIPTGGTRWQQTPEIRERQEALERLAIRRVIKHG